MSKIKAKTLRTALVSYLQGDVIAIVRPKVGSLFPGDVCQGAGVCQEPRDCLQRERVTSTDTAGNSS